MTTSKRTANNKTTTKRTNNKAPGKQCCGGQKCGTRPATRKRLAVATPTGPAAWQQAVKLWQGVLSLFGL